GTAGVGTASRDGDELVVALTRQGGISPAYISRGQPRVADTLAEGDRPGQVLVVGEVAGRANVLPPGLLLLEHGAERKPDRREKDRRRGNPAGRERTAGEQPAPCHRLTLEVSRGLHRRRSGGAQRNATVSVRS